MICLALLRCSWSPTDLVWHWHTRADPNVAVKRLAAEIFTTTGWNRTPTVDETEGVIIILCVSPNRSTVPQQMTPLYHLLLAPLLQAKGANVAQCLTSCCWPGAELEVALSCG